MNTPTQQTGGEAATPRTDVHEKAIEGPNPWSPHRFGAVPASFARQLERETATLHAPEALPEHAADSASAARTEATLWQRKYDEASTQLAAAQSEVGRLTKERDAAKKALDDTNEAIAHFTKLSLEPGKMEAHIEQHPALRELIAKTFAHMVADAPNYTELRFDLRGTDKWITVTVQKAEGKTPHQKRIEAESELATLRRERDELKEAGGKIGDEKLANLTERIESEYPAFGNDMPQYKAMRSWRIKRWVGDIFGEKLYGLVDELATLRRERDELRAELLTTHQMACRVGLERDELRAKQGEAP